MAKKKVLFVDYGVKDKIPNTIMLKLMIGDIVDSVYFDVDSDELFIGNKDFDRNNICFHLDVWERHFISETVFTLSQFTFQSFFSMVRLKQSSDVNVIFNHIIKET